MVFQNTHYSDPSLRSYCFPNLFNRGLMIKIEIGLSEYGVSEHQLQLIKTLLIFFSNLISRGSNNHTEDSKPGQPWIEISR